MKDIYRAKLMGREAYADAGVHASNPFFKHSKLWYAWSAGYGDAAREADGGSGHRAPLNDAERADRVHAERAAGELMMGIKS